MKGTKKRSYLVRLGMLAKGTEADDTVLAMRFLELLAAE